jgi:hypothetical protein
MPPDEDTEKSWRKSHKNFFFFAADEEVKQAGVFA